MSEDRNIFKVVHNIKKLIPSNYKKRDCLVVTLDDILNHASYTSPEFIGDRWVEVSRALRSKLGGPDTEWKKQIDKVFRGIS